MLVSVLFAVLGLACYFIYDISTVRTPDYRLGRSMFLIGSAFWCACQVMTLICGFSHFGFPHIRQLLLLPAAAFMALTVYAIFFAIPFNGVKLAGEQVVYKEGVYALCRHPGVLMFVLCELFTALSLPDRVTVAGCAMLALCDILYAVFQDAWTFPRSLKGYDQYRHETPFLIPTLKSIRGIFIKA